MNNKSTIPISNVLNRLFCVFVMVFCVHNIYASYAGKSEVIGGVLYRYDMDAYSTELGYGEAIAFKFVTGSVVNIETSIKEYPVGSNNLQIYRVTEIADQFCNRTGFLNGGAVENAYSGLHIPKYVRRIGNEAFAGCSKLDKIVFDSYGSLKTIGYRAFYDCSGIKEADLSSCVSLEVIGDEAFRNCTNLKYADIPSNVRSIGASAFANCEKMTSVMFSSGGKLKEIGAFAFADCLNLGERMFKIPEGVEIIGMGAFRNTPFVAFELPSTLLSIGSMAFYQCKKLQGSLIIPDNVREIGSSAFEGCSNICGSLIIGESVIMIGSDAFRNIGEVNAIIVKSPTPPDRGDMFPEELYKKAKLFVPEGTISEYSTARIWKDFLDIEELNYTPPQHLGATIGNVTLATDKLSNENLVVIKSGTRIPVKTIVTPSNSANDIVSWISQDTSVCVVKDGYLEMRNNGSTYLTANTCNNLKVTFKIQGGNPISEIELPDTVVVRVDQSISVEGKIKPSDCYDKRLLKWEVSNPSIVKLHNANGRGNLTGIEEGFAELIVQATDGSGIKNSCIVHVIPPSVASVSLDKTTFKYDVDETHEPIQLTANVSPKNACQDVIWTSDDEQIATVDSSGLVTFHGYYGVVRITATSVENAKKYDVCNISLEFGSDVLLNGKPCDSYKIFRVHKEDDVNEFRFDFKPSSLPVTDISFSSEDDTILSVDSVGNAKWLRDGLTKLNCSYSLYGKKYTQSYRILCAKPQYIEEIVLSESNMDVIYDDTFTLGLTIIPENAEYTSIEWISTNESIVNLDTSSNEGAELRAVGVGEADIIAKARYGNAQAVCHVIVRPRLISSITLNDNEQWLYVGSQSVLRAHIEPYYNASNKNLLWHSCDENIARISEVSSGGVPDVYCVVEGIGVGETDIIVKAEEGEAMASCHISVKPIKVNGITLNRQFYEGLEGDEFQLEAAVYPEDATDRTVKWRSIDDNIVSVDDCGKVQLKKAGDSYIYAYPADGTDTYASCYVVVRENTSGVLESIKADENSRVKIYDTHGFLIYDGLYSDAKLESGYYVILYDGKSIRVKIESTK